MTSTADLCPEEAKARATLLETRTMTMKVHSMLDALATDMVQFLLLLLLRTIPKLQLTNKYFVSFFEKCGDNGREDHGNELEKLRTLRDDLKENVRKLRYLYRLAEYFSEPHSNSFKPRPGFDYFALQFLLDAISRTRVLCRVHMFYDRIDATKLPNESYLRGIFPDARIKYVNIDEINW